MRRVSDFYSLVPAELPPTWMLYFQTPQGLLAAEYDAIGRYIADVGIPMAEAAPGAWGPSLHAVLEDDPWSEGSKLGRSDDSIFLFDFRASSTSTIVVPGVPSMPVEAPRRDRLANPDLAGRTFLWFENESDGQGVNSLAARGANRGFQATTHGATDPVETVVFPVGQQPAAVEHHRFGFAGALLASWLAGDDEIHVEFAVSSDPTILDGVQVSVRMPLAPTNAQAGVWQNVQLEDLPWSNLTLEPSWRVESGDLVAASAAHRSAVIFNRPETLIDVHVGNPLGVNPRALYALTNTGVLLDLDVNDPGGAALASVQAEPHPGNHGTPLSLFRLID